MLAALKYINIHTLPKPGQVNSRALWNAREELAGPFAAIIALALTKTERPVGLEDDKSCVFIYEGLQDQHREHEQGQ